MLVEHILPRARERLAIIAAGAPVRDAAEVMARPHIDLVIVCDAEGRMIGVLTKTDIVGQIRTCTGCNCTMDVDRVMTRDVISCQPGEWLQSIWMMMKDKGLQRVPVVDPQGKPLGIIYARDALQDLMNEVQHEESLLRDYVMCMGYR